jgi:hypothetical protein
LASFGGEIPEDIGYKIYKLGTLIQALNSKRSEMDKEQQKGGKALTDHVMESKHSRNDR